MRQQLGLKGRPVTSFDEAKASSIDFDGSVFYFPDLANGKIYTKQINLDGTATLSVYAIQELPVEETPSTEEFVTKEEFKNAIEQLRRAFAATPAPIPKAAEKTEYKF